MEEQDQGDRDRAQPVEGGDAWSAPSPSAALAARVRRLRRHPGRRGVVEVVEVALGQRDLLRARRSCRARRASPRAGRAGRGRRSARTSSSSASVVTRMRRSRRGAPPRNPFVYQVLCLRKARIACPLAQPRRPAGGRARASRPPRRRTSGGSSGSRPSNTSARSRKSHGRPRHPRPTITPSQPVRAHHAQRVLRLPDVAVAEHGDARHRLLQPRDRVPGRLAVVELGGGARVQADRGAALLLRDAAGVEVGVVRRRRCRCGT